ncbi:MAG: hypothetical protein A2Z34_10145 [Planctomycetes bacterium RBG_16_59_8]|nr:MAG: hypothetical protein A2Z34_10145 [Planctomycetes bacterium RBG_16_59_8]
MSKTIRLLVVEDEPSIREIVSMFLGSLAYDIDTAESGTDAIAKLEENAYDAIVSDIKMPGKSGIDLYEHLQERFPHLARRILFITGDMITPETNRFLAESGCPWIAKPFDLTDLLRKLQTIVGLQS